MATSVADHRTYVIAGDGCLMEGISHEAIALAGHLKLSKLIVLWDDNGITIDGKVSLSDSVDQLARFEAAGWTASRVDGHDPEAVAAALEAAQAAQKPVAHRLQDDDRLWRADEGRNAMPRMARRWARTRWRAPAPSSTGRTRPSKSRTTSARHGPRRRAAPPARTPSGRSASPASTRRRKRFSRPTSAARSHPALRAAIEAFKKAASEGGAAQATRISSQKLLDKLSPAQPNLIGGSADLTGSNNTKAADMKPVTPDDFSGRYIHYGIREFGMAAAMNGIALHGGFIPYGGTFLVFADYSRPAIRLAALMGIRVIHVLTHDSIGLGEDGPTHQPVEHLAALRAIPNLLVFRPADAVETAEAWELALNSKGAPSVIALSRQNLPIVRRAHTAENFSAAGGYVLRAAGRRAGRDPVRHRLGSVARGRSVRAARPLRASGRRWSRCPASNSSPPRLRNIAEA